MLNNIGKEIAKDVYDDLIHPSTEAAGALMSLPIRGLRVLCSPFEKYILNKEESLRITADLTKEKLAKIPPKDRCEPEAFIAVPIIQQICLSQDNAELRNMYSNLLVASMNTRLKNKVLPGFQMIIGQLSPDEAKLLKYIGDKKATPTIDIRYKFENNGFDIIFENYINIIDLNIEIIDNYNVYIDNLCRLNLIRILKDRIITDLSLYNILEENAKREINTQRTYDINKIYFQRGTMELTDFGKRFYAICLKEEC